MLNFVQGGLSFYIGSEASPLPPYIDPNNFSILLSKKPIFSYKGTIFRVQIRWPSSVAPSGRGAMIIGDYVNREQRHKKQVMGGFPAVNHLSDNVIVIY